MIFQQIIQNDHNSVAFVMYGSITRIICQKTLVNLHDFYSLNLWKILSGGLGWSSHTVKISRVGCSEVNTINKKVRFVFNLIRCSNEAEAVDPWNLIISTSLNPQFVIAYPKFQQLFSFAYAYEGVLATHDGDGDESDTKQKV